MNYLDILSEIALGIHEDGHQADAVFCSHDVFRTLAANCGFPRNMMLEISCKGPMTFEINLYDGPVKVFNHHLLPEPSMYVARRVNLGAGE